MNILLANMPIEFNSQESLEPPLGIAYLASVLERAGEKVYLKDFEIERFSSHKLESFIIAKEIDLIGISFRTASYRSAMQFILAIKKMKKVPLLVVGGHHVTAFPEHSLQDLNCDISVRAEAEEIILELVEALKNKQPLYQIKGISFREGDKVITTPKAPAIGNLDDLPYPARHLLPMERYNAITILTSRGCPFSCIYCDKGISTSQVKFRSPENVYNEILEVNRNYSEKRIYFVDDHFFLSRQRLNKIFDLIEKNGPRFSWICQARADGVDLKILRRAMSVGCKLIIYGIESGDPVELEYIKKQTTVEQARRTFFLTNQAGIKARANFMLGFPISTHNTIRNTIRFAKSVPLEVVRFFSVAPLPNTELWDRVYGRDTDLNKINWDEFDFYTPTYSTSELTQKDILGYVGAAYIHILKKRVLLELSLTLLPRFTKLLYSVFKKRRIRGFLSLAFPSTVNLLLDLKTVMRPMNLYKKIDFLVNAFYLERNLCKRGS